VLGGGRFVPGGPALGTLVSNAISVALLNWLVMPRAVRGLNFFLRPANPSWKVDVLGVAVMAAWLLGWFFFWQAVLPYLSQL